MNEPDLRFTYKLCKIFGKTPDSDFIENMDPVQKLFFYYNWIADQSDDIDLAKNQAYLIGSFWNPEAAKKMASGEGQHVSNEEEVEESLKMVLNDRDKSIDPTKPENKQTPRRRRRLS